MKTVSFAEYVLNYPMQTTSKMTQHRWLDLFAVAVLQVAPEAESHQLSCCEAAMVNILL